MTTDKKITFIFLFLNFFFFSFRNAFAQEKWVKYEGNPLGEFSYQTVSSPFIIFDGYGYKMWFRGIKNSSSEIALAFSNDGINWQEYEGNPVLGRDSSEIEIAEPSILFDGQQYKMWYTSTISPLNFRIRFATSPDGITWNVKKEPVLMGTYGSYDEEGTATPYVLFMDDVFKMWYGGRKYGRWTILYATSSDGINWTKRSTPVLMPDKPWDGNHVVRPVVLYENGRYIMFYQAGLNIPTNINIAYSDDGINWTKPENVNPLLSREAGTFYSVYISSPFVIKRDSLYQMWFAGSDGSRERIGYATSAEVISNTPIILLPGMFGSWNAEGMLEGKDVPYDQWKMMPFVHEYAGIIATLKNAGYTDSGENQDLFIFNYDWRKNIDSLADILHEYINAKVIPKHPEKKINLIGHSLGGLVARAYLQKYGREKVQNLITVGSPHKGVLPAYKAWEGGEIESQDPLNWLAQKFILQIYKSGVETDREVLQKKAPVVKDLLPTFDFLKKKEGGVITIEQMQVKNDYFLGLNEGFSEFFDIFQAILGDLGVSGEVGEWYKVEERSLLDQILGNWVDGRPLATEYGSGDKTVLAKSAKFEADAAKILSLNHRELIYKKEGILKILEALGISLEEDKIIEGEETKITPSLLLALLSPAKFKAICAGETYESGAEKILLLPQIELSDCRIEVIGEGEGEYQLIIGEIGEIGVAEAPAGEWLRIEGETSEGEVDSYDFSAESQEIPLRQARGLIEKMLKISSNRYLKRAKFYLELFENKEGETGRRYLMGAIENILSFRRKTEEEEMLVLCQQAVANLIRVVREIGGERNRREGKIAEIVLEKRVGRVAENLSKSKALSLDWGRKLLQEVKEKQEFVLSFVVKELSY